MAKRSTTQTFAECVSRTERERPLVSDPRAYCAVKEARILGHGDEARGFRELASHRMHENPPRKRSKPSPAGQSQLFPEALQRQEQLTMLVMVPEEAKRIQAAEAARVQRKQTMLFGNPSPRRRLKRGQLF